LQSRSGGGWRSARPGQIDEPNDDRWRDAGCSGCQLGDDRAVEERKLCDGPAGASATEYAVLSVPVGSAVVMVRGLPEQLHRKAFRADLDGQRSAVPWHEAHRNESSHGECKQQYACNQLLRGATAETGSHRLSGVACDRYYTPRTMFA